MRISLWFVYGLEWMVQGIFLLLCYPEQHMISCCVLGIPCNTIGADVPGDKVKVHATSSCPKTN